MTDPELISLLHERLAAGRRAVLVTVTGGEGSVPREPGAKMVVWEDGFAGTIGGGRLEAEAIVAARAATQSRAMTFTLEPSSLGMYCGGSVTVFIDVYAFPLRLVILGGGHVGEKVAAQAKFLGLPHVVVDDRPEYAKGGILSQPDAALKSLSVDETTAVVIVTRCHGFDLRALVAALQTKAFYVGMIGSRTKVERLFALCRRRGLTPDEPRVHAPIGLDLGGRTPEAIALAVLAEVLMVKNGTSGQPLSRKQVAA
jgi:xanthine dehydrogenase accessory factor